MILRGGRSPREELDRLRAAMSGLTKSEDGRFEYKTRLRYIQDRLSELGAVDEPYASEVARLRAEVAAALRDWATAAEAWSAVVAGAKGEDPDAMARLAIAHAQNGNFPAAVEQVRGLPNGRNSDRRRALRRVEGWMADYLVQHSHGAREAGDRAKAQMLLEAGLLLQGIETCEARETSDAVSQVYAYRKGDSTVEECRAGAIVPELKATPLFVSGFLYSGSGAVIDYLRGIEGISTEFSLQELGCFFGSYGPWKILHGDRAKIRHFVSNFVLWSMIGVTPPFDSPPPAPKASLAKVLPSADGRGELRAIGLDLIAELDVAESLSGEDLRLALGRALTRALTLATSPADYLLLNNTVRPYQYELLDLLPEPRAIAVMRDPRDQFIAQAVESSDAISLEKFIEQTRERMAAFSSYLSDGKFRDRVTLVQFEDFVMHASVRTKLLETLGLDTADSTPRSSFDAARSQGNVGIYKDRRWRKEVKTIEREMGDLIPPGLR